ncbi:hypothetical protein E3A20_28460 [Planctomyces bekefii]|uniref:Uncharacterized protein n=1 Tax=Planctomyces bekefii TaxID=1653850 RepID=A0A5C6M1I0_9PLAN|nr:hypothetical protein E3A20_28460 [Planctomyces bekefii]
MARTDEYWSNGLGGNADDGRVSGHVAKDNRAGADNRIWGDFDPLNDHSACTDVGALSDSNFTGQYSAWCHVNVVSQLAVVVD